MVNTFSPIIHSLHSIEIENYDDGESFIFSPMNRGKIRKTVPSNAKFKKKNNTFIISYEIIRIFYAGMQRFQHFIR